MAAISIASAKGGCGKTTLALLLGAELALEGYRVSLLDCDLNQHAVAFHRKAGVPGLTILPDVTEANVLSLLRQAEAVSDLVLIDLPGGSSTLALKALQRSHLVLVPAQASLPDVRDAARTCAQIDDAQDLARAPIARALVWTREPPGFESRLARHVRAEADQSGLPSLRAPLLERVAFREMHVSGRVPRQDNPGSVPAANVAALASEMLAMLLTLSSKAA